MAAARAARLGPSRELRALAATLVHPGPLLLVVLAALGAIALAYQVRPAYALQAGGRTDAMFWSHVNGREQDPASHATFRWTQGTTTLRLPGVGAAGYRVRLDLSGARPPGYPAPDVVVSSGQGEVAHLHPGPARGLYEVTVPAAATQASDGDLVLQLRTLNPFSPPGDGRELGVVVFGVDAQAVGDGLIAPPPRIWLGLAASAALLVLLLGLAGWGPAVQLGGGLAWIAGLAAFLAFNRLWITPLPGILLEVLAFAGVALLGLGPLWRRLYRAGGIAWPEPDQRGLLTIYGLAFVARLAGQLHPEIYIIDLLFHAHQFERVLDGQLFFTIQSDEWGGHYTFYLPTPYVLMLPLQALLHDELLTIRLFGVLLDTVGVFLVYYLARRAFGDGRAGLAAAVLQVAFPIAILPFSWGITANLYGQFAGLAVIAVLVGAAGRLTRPGPWLLLVLVLVGALLSHPGSVQLTALLVGGLLLVDFGFWILDFGLRRVGMRRAAGSGQRAVASAEGLGIGDRGSGIGDRGSGIGDQTTNDYATRTTQTVSIQNRKSKIQNTLALLAALGVAAGIAWVGYYAHYAAFELHEYQALQQERAAARAQTGFSVTVGGEVGDKSLGLRPHVVHDVGAWLVEGVQGFGAEAWAYFGAWPLLWAVCGLVAAGRGPPRPGADAAARQRMLRLAAVWAGVVGLYTVVGLVANLYVRYALFALPLVALGAGLLLSALSRRGRWGVWLLQAVLLAATLQALVFWYTRITVGNK